jgi:hypothetical protein
VGVGVQTGSTRHVGHLLAYYCTCPGWLWGWRIWWNELAGETEVLGKKPAPAPLCPPQIPLDQTRARTRAVAVGSQRLTAWAMARPCGISNSALAYEIDFFWLPTKACLTRPISSSDLLGRPVEWIFFHHTTIVIRWPHTILTSKFTLNSNNGYKFWVPYMVCAFSCTVYIVLIA